MKEKNMFSVVKDFTDIWDETLGVSNTEASDNFFKLGGSSLSAMVLVARVQETFGVELPIGTIFELPTLGELCEKISTTLRASDNEAKC